MNYIVIDDILTEERAEEFYNSLDNIKWDSIPYGGSQQEFAWKEGTVCEYPQHHYLIDYDKYYEEFVRDMMQNETVKTIIADREYHGFGKINKVSAPPNVEWNEGLHGSPHIDAGVPGLLTGIYYINDASGDTILFNEKWDAEENKMPEELTVLTKIQPKKNRLVLFDGFTWHSAGVPKSDTRYVLNIAWADKVTVGGYFIEE
jgi:hypothetical protein